MTALFKRLADAKKAKDVQAQQVVAGSLTNLMKENDVSPFRPLLMPLIQMPFFLAFFWGLRSLAQLPLPQLKEGGFGWVMDLTLSDPYYVLPVTSMLLTNLVLRVSLRSCCYKWHLACVTARTGWCRSETRERYYAAVPACVRRDHAEQYGPVASLGAE